MRRIRSIALSMLLAVSLLGCGKEGPQTPLTSQQFDDMLHDVKKYKGSPVEIYGAVFATPQRLEKMVYLQVYADPVNYGKSVIIAFENPSLDVGNGDYIHVVGKVKDEFTGENTFGIKLSVPRIIADTVEKTGPHNVMSPPSN
ncbi:LptM family lipoprotein [Paenibacillus hexagrammi]|uniref:Lipoprotein n=1 Tax=Paenibacillus hexagrammi TaxID=2908839 RepID=A0ABY3SNB2_9BACL|nr:hypothetical protein [Paenibacillus sp. YPD9-1]UJF35482.1 hypothetical protein L0M14_10480 [Paenibacillus sp. YPD9-1]